MITRSPLLLIGLVVLIGGAPPQTYAPRGRNVVSAP